MCVLPEDVEEEDITDNESLGGEGDGEGCNGERRELGREGGTLTFTHQPKK